MSNALPIPLLERYDVGAVTVVRITGPELHDDETTAAVFDELIDLVEGAGRSRLVLNLEGIQYVASSATGKLVTLMRKVRSVEGRLVLCKVSRRVEEALRLFRLLDVLLLYADEQEAVRSFR